MEGSDSTVTQDVSVWYRATVNAIAVDEGGQYACLGGKKALYIVDLDDPWEAVKTLHQQSKFEVSKVQYNPHASHHSYIASTANTSTMIWNLDDRRFALQATFRSHERPVLDIGWSFGDANLLATCSADMNVALWDTRSPKSALRLTTISPRAAVHLLKWSRKQTNLMATASAGEIRIWDIRKEKTALTHITAHMGKISAIDWSYNMENELLTAGQDAQVKIWDTTNPRKEKTIIHAGLPLALASYTPFGSGVVTVAQRDDFCPRLWSLSDPSSSVHAFGGENAHTDIVTAVEWRTSMKHGEKKHQLITWSKDQHLKFWKVDQGLTNMLSGRSLGDGDIFGISNTPVSSLGVPSPRGHRTSPRDDARVGLTQEFALLRQNPIKGIAIKTLDTAQAYCEASARVGPYMQDIKITFPSAYPHSAPPSFHLPPNATVSTRTRNKLKEVLSDVADMYVNVSRPCLEPCLSQLVTSLEAEATKNKDHEAPPSMGGLLGLGFEGLGIDSIMGMGPLGMGLGASSGLGIDPSSDTRLLEDRPGGSVSSSASSSRLVDGSNPFGLSMGSSHKRHGDQTSSSNGNKKLATVTSNKEDVSDAGADISLSEDKDEKRQRTDLQGSLTREKSSTVTGGSGVGGIGRASSAGGRMRSYSAAESALTSAAASILMSPTSMSPSSPAVASPSSSYLFARDESIPAPRSCGAIFGVDGLVEFCSFASGDSSAQALLSSRTYADLKRQLGSRESSTAGISKSSLVEITKLYFYEEVVDLLPIKMDLSSHGKGQGAQAKGPGCNVLVMRSIAPLLPISRELAIEYTLTGISAHDICNKNCLAAKKVGRKDLVQLWTLISQLTHPSLSPSFDEENSALSAKGQPKSVITADYCPWSYHPFGRSLVSSLFRYYQSMGDIQTLAMLVCVLSFSSSTSTTQSPAPPRIVAAPPLAAAIPTSTSSSSFFPSLFRRDTSEPDGKGEREKPHKEKLPRELSLGAGMKLKHLKRERVNSSSFIVPPSLQSSTGSLSFSNIEQLNGTSPSTPSLSPRGDASSESSPPPPPPPPEFKTSPAVTRNRIAQSINTSSSPSLRENASLASVGDAEIAQGAGSASEVSPLLSAQTRSGRLPTLLSVSPNYFSSHMGKEDSKSSGDHKRSQSLSVKNNYQGITQAQENLNSLLDPSKVQLYEFYKRSYGEVLFRWGLLEKRAEVLKYLQSSSKHQSRMCIGVSLACHNCGQPVSGSTPLCSNCRVAAFRCTICHIPVRGLSNFCLACGHGGHMHHMRQWFEKQSFCPSGCGCPCLSHTPSLLSA